MELPGGHHNGLDKSMFLGYIDVTDSITRKGHTKFAIPLSLLNRNVRLSVGTKSDMGEVEHKHNREPQHDL